MSVNSKIITESDVNRTLQFLKELHNWVDMDYPTKLFADNILKGYRHYHLNNYIIPAAIKEGYLDYDPDEMILSYNDNFEINEKTVLSVITKSRELSYASYLRNKIKKKISTEDEPSPVPMVVPDIKLKGKHGLAKYSPQELIDELYRRGYHGTIDPPAQQIKF